MKYFILPYKNGSTSAKLLASALNCKKIKTTHSNFIHRANKLVINWGVSNDHPRVNNSGILNRYEAVERASNKILTLKHLKEAGVPHVEFTTDKTVAQAWVNAGNLTYSRHLVSSSGGRGISLNYTGPVLDAPLYTRAFPTKREYRVHVFKGSVIDITQKRKRRECEEVNRQIRNHANGWVFCHNDINQAPIPVISPIAIAGVEALGLDFGAVDILVDRNNNAVICEINSAPGIEGTTLEKYKQAFLSYLEQVNEA